MNSKKYIKKYWQEEDTLFLIAFEGEYAERQLEIQLSDFFVTSINNPFDRESMLYDQKLSELDLSKEDFITEEEFNKTWDKYQRD